MLEIARQIEAALAKVPGVSQAAVAGSIRRHRETIGDVDLLVASSEPERVSRLFESLPEVQAVFAHGPTKTLVRLTNGMDADLRVLAPESFGAALLYFTGSKAHNVALRKIAIKQDLKLNEYDLFRDDRSIAGRTEDEVYRALGLSWIPPKMREDLSRFGAPPSHRFGFRSGDRGLPAHGHHSRDRGTARRLDLPDNFVRKAVEAGVRIAIDSDAHTVDELRYLEAFGLGVARRGWARASDVVNTLSSTALVDLFERPTKTRESVARA